MRRWLLIFVTLLAAPMQAQVVPSQAIPRLDVYGGIHNSPCTGGSGATGFFYIYKDTAIKHWMFCDPLGNRFFFMGAQDINDNNYNISVATKYAGVSGFTGREEFYRVMVGRLQNLGFNVASEAGSILMFPVGTSDPNSVAMPFSFFINPARYGLWPDVMTPLSLAPPKSLIPLLPTSYNSFASFHGVLGWRASDTPDYWDPNWTNYINNKFTSVSPDARILDWVSAATLDASPYLIAIGMGDSDDQWALRGAHGGWIAGAGPSYVAYMMTAEFNKEFLYTDTKNYTKAQLQTYLTTKYTNVAGLNAAWGSSYSTLGSSATTVASETIGTGTGAQISFTHTLGHALVDPGSILVSVGGTASAGDCPWFEAYCNNSVAAGSGNIRGLASNVNANGGTVSYSTYTLGTLTQTASDNFNRADANPLSGNWTKTPTAGPSALQIVSHIVKAVINNANYEYSTAVTWPNDQYSEVTIGSGGTNSPLTYLEARVRQVTNDYGAYACQLQGATGASATLNIQKQDNFSGNYHSLATGTFSVSVADKLGCAVVGNNIYLILNGVTKLSASDGSYASGQAAMGMFCTTDPANCGTITAWDGGSAVQTASAGSITVTFSVAPGNGVAITMSYQYGGWPAGLSGGTGLLDEDGTHSWYPTAIANPPSGTVQSDLDNFYGQIVTRFHSTMNTAIKANLPHHLVTNTDPVSIDLPATFWSNAAPYVDYFFVSNSDAGYVNGSNGQQFATANYNLTSKPMVAYLILSTYNDSPYIFADCPTLGQGTDVCAANQNGRGTLYQNIGNAWWGSYAGADSYGFMVGWSYWASTDTNATNFGLTSLNDNLYDGIESANKSRVDPWGFITTAESSTYGSASPSFTPLVLTTNATVGEKIVLAGGLGQTSTNLGLEQPVSFPSETSPNPAHSWGKANDSLTSTSWIPTGGDPQSYRIDLFQQTVGKVILRWGAGFYTGYTIDTSNDGLSWTTQFTKAGGTGGVETDTFTPVTARYIRVNGTARSGTPALQEFEVYAQ